MNQLTEKIRQMRGTFAPPISQQLGAWFYFFLFVFLLPILFLGLVFCEGTSKSSDKWVPIVLAFAGMALGLLLFLKTGVKYDFSTTGLTVKNQIGFVVKTIGYHDMITATTQSDRGMIFLIITSRHGDLRIQMYKTMLDKITDG